MSRADLCLCSFITASFLSEAFAPRYSGRIGVSVAGILLFLVSSAIIVSGRQVPRRLLISSLCAFLILFIPLSTELQTPRFGMDESRIVQIQGRAVADSSVSSSGKFVIRVRLSGCLDASGNRTGCSGVINAVGEESSMIEHGCTLVLDGEISEDGRFFIFSNLSVVRPRSGSGLLRMKVIQAMVIRLRRNVSSGCGSLLCYLLTGRNTEGSEHLREAASESGCLHILALSGLHLGFFLSLARIGARSPWERPLRFVSLVLALGFVWLIGPRSSLNRAAIAAVLGVAFPKLKGGLRLAVCAVIQVLFFPYSVPGTGCAYSYLAICGIITLGQVIRRGTFRSCPKALRGQLGASWGAVCVTGVYSLLDGGEFHPLALILSPPAGFLAFAVMCTGALKLVFPGWGPVCAASEFFYRALSWLFGLQSSAGWAVMAGLWGVVLTGWFVLKYSEARLKREARKHDLGLQLRFSGGDQSPVG